MTSCAFELGPNFLRRFLNLGLQNPFPTFQMYWNSSRLCGTRGLSAKLNITSIIVRIVDSTWLRFVIQSSARNGRKSQKHKYEQAPQFWPSSCMDFWSILGAYLAPIWRPRLVKSRPRRPKRRPKAAQVALWRRPGGEIVQTSVLSMHVAAYV